MTKYSWSFVFTLAFSSLSSAATLIVDKNDLSCSDSTGTPFCSISAGIAAATDGDTISIGAGTYSENLTVLKSLTIVGTGSATTIVDGGANGRVFFTAGTVSISDLTVQNGDAGDTGLGGGIWVNGGSLTLTDSVVRDNIASDGGGIGTGASVQLSVIRSLISGNTATNSFGNSSGGGLDISGPSTHIIDSTISNNTSDYEAGGIFNFGRATTITNSTISGNFTLGSGAALVNGSGSSANIVISSVTITDNTANASNGGILNRYGEVRLHNSLVAGNSDSGYAPDCAGEAITSDGYNFIGTTAGCTFNQATGDLLDQGAATARIAPLTSNSGATPVHEIQSGSAVGIGDRPRFSVFSRKKLKKMWSVPY